MNEGNLQSDKNEVPVAQETPHKELLTILIISVVIVVIFAVLYYFESNNSLMTDLSQKVTNYII